MPRLVFSLLGPPRITLDGVPLDTHASRAIALLSYLVVTQKTYSREYLASLLWPDSDPEQAFGALRTTLWRLRKGGFAKWIEIKRQTIGIPVSHEIWLDVAQFQDLLASCETHDHHPNQTCQLCIPVLEEAISLYRGDFLQGFTLSKAASFSDWQVLIGEALHRDAVSIYRRLVHHYRQNGQIEQAIQLARKWSALDRLDEEVHRLLMRMYADIGQRSAAISQYEICKKILERENKMEPAEETTRLYQQIVGAFRRTSRSSEPLKAPIFLFIDLENAAALWARYHDQVPKIFNRVQAIIHDCLKLFSGSLIKQSGENFMILFERGQPLHCALEIQRRVISSAWNESAKPHLRMALNTANIADEEQTDVLPLELHSTAQLLAAGWGGQILLTAQVLSIVELPPGAKLQDHGLHTFKNLSEPTRIYELLHPDLPPGKPIPIKSLSRLSHNLPAQTTAFVGREKEIHDISTLLDRPDVRLITLIGPGGIGKTRLALQIAAQRVELYQDGTYFVTLAAVKHPHQIPNVLAEALRVNFYSAEDPLTHITNYLRSRYILLIMDNMEHLVQGAEVLSDILSEAPNLTILATSRERLKLHGEWVYEIEGLPYARPGDPPEEAEQFASFRLFLHSARRALPGFRPSSADKAAIQEICQLLEGIPLGLELAASWVRTLRCEDIAAEIKRDLDFLESPLRDLPPRHRSLRAVFDHSWELLSEEERSVLCRISVFRGGFSQEAAQEIANASPKSTMALVDQSMLRRLPNGRYEMLEVLRHYASDKLRQFPGEPQATFEKHCRYYANILQQKFYELVSHKQSQALEEIRLDLENIYLAWQWAASHACWQEIDHSQAAIYRYHEMLGRFREGKEIFAEAISLLSGQVTPATEAIMAKLKMWEAWFSLRLGRHEAGIQGMENTLQSFRQANMKWETAYTLSFLADAYRMNGDLSKARQLIEESLRVYPVDDHPIQVLDKIQAGQNKYLLGTITLLEGNPMRAKSILEESRDILASLGNLWAAGHVTNMLASVAIAMREYEQAKSLQHQVLEIMEKLGDRRGMAVVLNNISDTYEKLGQDEEAIQSLLRSLAICHEIGEPRLTAVVLVNLAYHFLSRFRNPSQAIRLYQESLEMFKNINDLRGVVYVSYDLGNAYLQAEQVALARGSYCNALFTAFEMGNKPLILHSLHGFAQLYAHLSDLTRAVETCSLILAHSASEADTRNRAAALLSELETRLPAEQMEAARSKGQNASLEDAVAHALISSPRI